jgi:hypothetical protein
MDSNTWQAGAAQAGLPGAPTSSATSCWQNGICRGPDVTRRLSTTRPNMLHNTNPRCAAGQPPPKHTHNHGTHRTHPPQFVQALLMTAHHKESFSHKPQHTSPQTGDAGCPSRFQGAAEATSTAT